MSAVIEVTDLTFEEEILKSEIPVLLDYWAQWCNPCLMIAPVLDEIAEEYEGRVKVCKINIETNPQTPQKYSIRAIPTLMIFKDASVAATKVSVLTRSELAKFISEHI